MGMEDICRGRSEGGAGARRAQEGRRREREAEGQRTLGECSEAEGEGVRGEEVPPLPFVMP